MHKSNGPSGAVLYRGPSRINKKPIVTIMTFRSSNVKTGDIPQVWIMVEDLHPHDARSTGEDVRVCGGCIFGQGKGCYVKPLELSSIYRTYRAGRYGDVDAAVKFMRRAQPKAIRIGAYGDPVSVPIEVWQSLAAMEPKAEIIGYTQMWRWPVAQGHKAFCMASTKSVAEAEHALRKGWRSFRVALPDDPAVPHLGEVICPATVNEDATCENCRMCLGGQGSNVMLTVHGNRATLPKAVASMTKLREKST